MPSDLPGYKIGARDIRPWGDYEVTAVGPTAQGEEFCEKKITVLPGHILSLQSHALRRELWHVEQGELTVVLNDQMLTLKAGNELKVPLGSIHAMANLSDSACIVFERQEGVCREDDIIRYLDAYGRDTAPPTDPVATASLSVYKKILSALKPERPFAMPSPNPASLPEWKELEQHQTESHLFQLRTLLSDPERFKEFGVSVHGVHFDFSKHLATSGTMKLLTALARARNLEGARDDMFEGKKINTTENRAVLHTALRSPAPSGLIVDNEDAMIFIHSVLEKMSAFCDQVRSGQYKGYTGKPFTDAVNIGIGGSDLGPRFVCEALQDYHGHVKLHFVSNVDGSAMNSILKRFNPETTLFIVASKTFTTEETMLNARVARDWLVRKTGSDEAVSRHFVALSTNEKDVKAFGIAPDNMFPFRDWVGGRYSLWSAIGLPIMLSIGPQNFRSLLAGAHAMDTHFRTAPLEQNVPVLMGLLGVWYRNFWDYPTHLLLPYDDRLAKLAKYIQQMDMESNGKSVDKDGQQVSYQTGPFLFGEPGTDSQHSFMQLVHQGTTPVPADFITCVKPHHDLPGNHRSLLANCLAQSRALAIGQTLDEANDDPFRVFSGNRPSTTILLPELSPFILGLLLAAYEHKVFVQGVIWNLNSFDQPGVELGKKLAKPLSQHLAEKKIPADLDASTKGLLSLLQ